jgi:hypothetical protein
VAARLALLALLGIWLLLTAIDVTETRSGPQLCSWICLIVAGELGPKEIGKLIKLLKAQQVVLSDEDEEAAH